MTKNITSDYLEWNDCLILIQRLEQNKDYLTAMLFCVGTNTGLRFSDISQLRWTDILNNDSLIITEKKTRKCKRKPREIKINSILKEFTKNIFSKLSIDENNYIFVNKKNKIISIQYINKILKNIKILYKIKIKNFSTHSLRKTFGRRIWEMDNQSERALIMLSDIFQHSSSAITKRYLGIRQQEISQIYDLLNN